MFYNEGEYNKWKENENNLGWTIKYYKGLGTSTATEFKEYFKIISVSGYFWVAYWNLAVSLSKGGFPQSKENKLKTFIVLV